MGGKKARAKCVCANTHAPEDRANQLQVNEDDGNPPQTKQIIIAS